MSMTCGICRECCIHLRISSDAIDGQNIKKYITQDKEFKEKHEPCPQLNPIRFKPGCTIYSNQDKPKICSTYQCSFTLGELGQDLRLRPDNLGVIFDTRSKEFFLRCIETKPNALKGKLAQEVQRLLLEEAYASENDWEVQILPYKSSVGFQGKVKLLKTNDLKIGK